MPDHAGILFFPSCDWKIAGATKSQKTGLSAQTGFLTKYRRVHRCDYCFVNPYLRHETWIFESLFSDSSFKFSPHLTDSDTFFWPETLRPQMVLTSSMVLFFHSTLGPLQSTDDSLILLVLSWFPNNFAFLIWMDAAISLQSKPKDIQAVIWVCFQAFQAVHQSTLM